MCWKVAVCSAGGLDSNRYRLGLHLYDLGCQALDHVNIRDEARPFMTRIALEVGETVHLAVLDRAEVLYIERVEAQRSLTMGSKLGGRNPVYCTALGKAILYLPRIWKSSRFLPHAAWSKNQEHIYQRACVKTRAGAYSRSGLCDRRRRVEDGIRCVSAPILNLAVAQWLQSVFPVHPHVSLPTVSSLSGWPF